MLWIALLAANCLNHPTDLIVKLLKEKRRGTGLDGRRSDQETRYIP